MKKYNIKGQNIRKKEKKRKMTAVHCKGEKKS